jgi:hypothetical protein
MARLHTRRSRVIVASVVILFIALAAAPPTVAHLAGWLSVPPRAASHAPRAVAAHRTPAPLSAATTQSAQGAAPASVRLVVQDLTPAAHLRVSASGFLRGEHLAVTIQDLQGHPYEQVTLVAGSDGRLRETSLALPPQLASGTYQVLVVGSTSHRTARTTFQMHDIPPTVALDAYTATPGQTIGFVGHGFIPGEEVLIYLGDAANPLVQVRATVEGAVSGRLTVPSLVAGTYTLTTVGAVSQTPISVGFNIQGFAPWVVLDRYALTPGEGLGFIGQGFAPNEPVLVYLNDSHGNPALHVTADSSGRIVVQDTWTPSGESGQNVLTFVGQWSKATTVAQFTILPATQPTPAPTFTAP